MNIDAESKAKLLAKGIESKDKNVEVEIKDISYTPMSKLPVMHI